MKRAILFFLANSLLGTLVYGLVLYLTFPSDAARDRLIYEANKAGVRMQLVGVKPAWPWGFTLHGLDIYSFGDGSSTVRTSIRSKKDKEDDKASAPDAAAPDAGAPPVPPGVAPENAAAGTGDKVASVPPTDPAEAPVLTLDRVSVTSLLKTLMSGGKTVDGINFDASLYGGSLSGSYGQEDEFSKIAVKAEKIDLAKYPFQGESYSVKASGVVGLDVDLSLHKDKVRESSGTFAFLADTITLYKGSKVKGVDIPMDVTFKVSGGSAEIKNGRAELQELKLESAPITVTVTGSIMLNQSFMRSRANLKVAILYGDELKMVAAFSPESARSADGAVHYIMSGPLNNLRTRPDRLAARRAERKLGGTPGVNPPAGFSADMADRPPMPRPPMPGFTGPNGMPEPGEMNLPGVLRPPVLDEEERERLREERRKRAEERRRRREELRQRRLEMGGDAGYPPGMVGDPNPGNDNTNDAPDVQPVEPQEPEEDGVPDMPN